MTTILIHSVKSLELKEPKCNESSFGSHRAFWTRKLMVTDDQGHVSELTMFADTEEPLKLPSAISPDLLYAIGMESRCAYENMELLCKALGVPFPPNQTKETV